MQSVKVCYTSSMAFPALKSEPEEAYLDADELQDAARPASVGEPSSHEDPFRLGWRIRRGDTPDPREVDGRIPLSAEDLLYPQEGDVVSDGFPHFSFLHPLVDALRRYLRKRRSAMLVTCDVTLVLGDGKHCGPDIAVIRGEIDTSSVLRAVDLRRVGGELVFALEAVSTSEKEIENKDLVGNVQRYAKERVSEYFSVYPVVDRKVKKLVGRRLQAGDYFEIPPDAEGRVYSEQLDLFFQIEEETEELVAFDAKTGEQVLISDEVEAKAEAESARADAEATARKAAEARAEDEEAARKAAEAKAQEQVATRKAAEDRARAAEEKIAQLEALLRRQD